MKPSPTKFSNKLIDAIVLELQARFRIPKQSYETDEEYVNALVYDGLLTELNFEYVQDHAIKEYVV